MTRELSLATRLTIVIVALVIFTAGTVGFLGYRRTVAVAAQRTVARLDTHARALAADLASIMRNARADVRGFRFGVGLVDIIAKKSAPPIDGWSFSEWRDRVATRYKAELEAKPDYGRFQVIGIADQGLELIRVQRDDDGIVRIVADAELQRTDRAAFEPALAAGNGGSILSTTDLAAGRGGITAPPSVLASAPLFTAAGAPFGVLTISIGLREIFQRFSGVTGFNTRIFLVNDRGDYLIGPDTTRIPGVPWRIQDDLPALQSSITTGGKHPELVADRNGKRFFIGIAPVRLGDGPRLAVVEIVAETTALADPTAAVWNSSLIGGAIAVLCAVLMAVAFARSLVRPLTEMTAAVAGFSQHAPLRGPLQARGEIGVLARAFTKMAGEVREKTAAIQHDQEVFESIMATMAESVLVIDMSGDLIYQNSAADGIVGTPLDRNGGNWSADFDVYHADGVTPLPRDAWPSSRCLRGESIDECEMQFRLRSADALKYLLCSARPIRDAAGVQTGAVLVTRDVTAVKQTERQLQQSQRLDAIGQLTGGVAHDFNNMLTVISGSSEILLEELADRPSLLMIAKMIVEAADRGAELTKHLLAFARRQPLQPRNIDVNSIVLDTVKLLRPSLGEQIQVDSRLAAELQPAHIDPSQLSAALLNLAVNARDAMPNGGKLLLETENIVLDDGYSQNNMDVVAGRYVMIAVSDTGTGIPASLRDKVFEPFFTTKEVGKGTGLGLSMVYGFVKQSNGHIKIYSEEGHGTTIRLYLPLASGTPDVATPAEPIEGGGETILVVEDDPLVRDFVVAQLQSLGYRTLTAPGAVPALAAVRDGTAFDLLFTDVIMPGGMNGRELADAVLQLRPQARILYTSGYTENAIVHHGRLDPNVLLLAKPYRKSELARMVRVALTQHGAAAAGDDLDQPAAVGAG